MAKCAICSARKGKRYCAPLDKVICAVCCAEDRMSKIDCNESCRFLEGVSFQKKRSADKAFSDRMSQVGHGQHDDIFHDSDVAMMAYDIESLVRDLYVRGDMGLTDTRVYNAYRDVFSLIFDEGKTEGGQVDDLTGALLTQFEKNHPLWKQNLDEETMGKVYLRLMISVKAMRGGRFGEYGYLNYLKNNFDQDVREDEFIAEDKYGHKTVQKLS